MTRKLILVALAVVTVWSTTAIATPPAIFPLKRAQNLPWHNTYYDPAWGQPVALVVPPTAEMQTQYGWGVGGTRVTPIYHQFQRPYPGPYAGGGGPFSPTPYWPSDTTQFGVHYVRGPW